MFQERKTLNISVILSILFIITFQLFYQIYGERMPSVSESHFLISYDFSDFHMADISNEIYFLLRTPIYNLLDFVFQSPFIFAIFTYLGDLLIPIILFSLLYKLTGSTIPSLVALILFSPFTHYMILRTFYVNGILGVSIFPSPDEAFEWGHFQFSIRVIFGIIAMLCTYFFIKKKYYSFTLLLILSIFVHPSSFLILSLIFFLVLMISSYKYHYPPWIKFIIPIIMICGIIPAFYKIHNLPDVSITNLNWYRNMIKDEADDFSLIYKLIYSKIEITFYILISSATIYIANKRIQNKELVFNLSLLLILPGVMFLFFLIIETVSVLSGFMIIISPVISLQLGHKILSFSYFPVIFLWALIFNNIHMKISNKNIFNITLIIFSTVFVFLLIYNKKFHNQYNYFKGIYNIEKNTFSETLILKNSLKNKKNPSISKIFVGETNLISDKYTRNYNPFEIRKFDKSWGGRLSKLNSQYDKKYNHLHVYIKLLDSIRLNIDNYSSIIMPPYLKNIRDSLPNYNIFFQEKHDGNLMMGHKKIAAIMLKRMKDLLKNDYTSLPSRHSALHFTYIRKMYLNLNTKDVKKLKVMYPEYKYFITETQHELDLKQIYRDEYFTIYKI